MVHSGEDTVQSSALLTPTLKHASLSNLFFFAQLGQIWPFLPEMNPPRSNPESSLCSQLFSFRVETFTFLGCYGHLLSSPAELWPCSPCRGVHYPHNAGSSGSSQRITRVERSAAGLRRSRCASRGNSSAWSPDTRKIFVAKTETKF